MKASAVKALAIDTSTQAAIISLFDDSSLIGYKELELGYNHAKHLLEYIKTFFTELNLTASNLSYVAVGKGPGSYTGIRVGVSCAKAIAVSCGIPLVGFSSLRGFSPSDDFEGTFVVAIDAKMGGVYLIEAKKINKKIVYTSDEKRVSFEAFVDILSQVDCLITPFYEPLKKRLNDVGVHVTLDVQQTWPSAIQIMHEAQALFLQEAYSMDGNLELFYA